MNQKKIGTFIAECRKKEKLTQVDLAEKLGVTNRSVSNWERGNNMPDIDILIDISDFYEVDLSELLNGEERL